MAAVPLRHQLSHSPDKWAYEGPRGIGWRGISAPTFDGLRGLPTRASWLLAAGRSRPRLRFHEAESPALSVDASTLHSDLERPVKRYCWALCACERLLNASQYHLHGGDRRSSTALGEGAHPARAYYDLLQATLDTA